MCWIVGGYLVFWVVGRGVNIFVLCVCILNVVIGVQIVCLSVFQYYCVVWQEVFFDVVFYVLFGIYDDCCIVIYFFIGYCFVQVFYCCFQFGIRVVMGIQFFFDGFEGMEQCLVFWIKYDDIYYVVGVQCVGFDIVGWVICGFVMFVLFCVVGLCDVVCCIVVYIYFNWIEGFIGYGVFVFEYGRNCLYFFDLSNGQFFVLYVLYDDVMVVVSWVCQILWIFIWQVMQGYLWIYFMFGFDIFWCKFRGGVVMGMDNFIGNNW